MTGDDVPIDGVPDVNVADFDTESVAESVVDAHEEGVEAAIESAVAHTLIDGAHTEIFVDRLRAATIRKAIRTLEEAAFGFGDTAIYAGTGAVSKLHDALPDRARDRLVGDGAKLHVDGIPVFETANVPKNIAVVVDPDALARIPSDVVRRRVGGKDAATVTSPVMVRDAKGVVVVNIAED